MSPNDRQNELEEFARLREEAGFVVDRALETRVLYIVGE